MGDRVDRIRHFNRVITRRLGVLDQSFLGCGVSLGKARLLFEIHHGTVELQRLRAKLGLDSGQMSRMLRALERQRLIETSVSPGDARARTLALTAAGQAKLRELEGRANEGAQSWLAPLSPARQADLDRALDVVLRILSASEVSIAPEDPRSDAATWCLDQFFRELDSRFEGGFDRLRTNPAPPESMTPPAGVLLVASLPEKPVGCAALLFDRKQKTGEVKRMWVSPDVRGLGVGRRLLEAVEQRARRGRLQRLRLETNRALTEAMALYRAAGYREIPLFDKEPYAHFAFEKRLA